MEKSCSYLVHEKVRVVHVQVMSNRNEQRSYVSRHTEIPSLMATPIEDWNADDVWSYVLSSSPPWGGDNNELVTMYRNAQPMPLVIDKSTPSCGGGRFGCWTCTVVQRDRSMEAMIDNGELDATDARF